MKRSIALFSGIVVVGGAVWVLTAWAQQPTEVKRIDVPDGGSVEIADEFIGDPNKLGAKLTTADAFDKNEVEDSSGAPSPADLKARYTEAEGRLAEVADEVAAEIALNTFGNADGRQSEKLAERVRGAVRAVFEARQTLQHAQLADLQRRVTKTQRALAVREHSKQAIIEERTGNLMDEIESGGWRKSQDRHDKQKTWARTHLPRKTDLDLASQGRLLALELASESEEAKANLAQAKSAYAFADKMHRQGYATSQERDASASTLRRAELQLKRTQVRLDALSRHDAAEPLDDHPLTDAADLDLASQGRLLALDAEEAKVGLAEAQAAYDQAVKLRDAKAISEEEVARFASELKRAELQVERSQIRLDALSRQDAASTSGNRPLAGAADAPDLEEKLLQLDLEEAKLNLSTAQATHVLHHSANKKRPNSTPKKEMVALEAAVALAKIQVERAQTKLDLHKRQYPLPVLPAQDSPPVKSPADSKPSE